MIHKLWNGHALKRMSAVLGVVLIVMIVGVLAPACGGGAPKTFKIGNLSSFTGALSPYGQPISDAFHLAVDMVNARGGLMGKIPIEVIDEDTQTDPNVAVQKARKLFDQDKVDAIFGVEASNLRDAITPEVEQRKKILLYPANYEGERYSKYVFYLGMVPTQEFHPALADLLSQTGGGKKWYLLGADYVAIQMINKYIKDVVVPAAGIQVVGDELIPLTQTDFAATVQRIIQAKPNVIINNLIGEQTIPFQQQLANFGLTPLRAGEAPGTPGRVVMEGTAYQTLTITAMGETAEGAYRSIQWNDDLNTPENKAYVEGFQKTFPGRSVIYISESGYNGVLALEAAAKKVNSVNVEDLIRGLEGIQITAPSGPYELRATDHHAILNMYLTQVQSGRFVTVQSYGQVAPAYDQREKRYSGS